MDWNRKRTRGKIIPVRVGVKQNEPDQRGAPPTS